MEGRYSNGVLAVLTRSTDPAREEELSRWYDEVHVPDMMEGMGGSIHDPVRWRNTALALEEEQPRFVATYETEQQELEVVFEGANREYARAMEQGRLHECLKVVRPGTSIYRRMGPEFRAATGRPVRGLLFVITECSDPAQEDDFNRWYNETHIPDIFATGLYHTAYRYEKVRYKQGRGRYLAMYETDGDPGEALREILEEHRPQWRAQDRYIESLRVNLLESFQRL